MKSALLLIVSIGLASCATQAPAAISGSPAPAESAKKKEPEPKPYPLETCLVTGDDLDEMDDRVSTVYKGQTFEFCCKPCLKKFRKNPGKYKKALEKELHR